MSEPLSKRKKVHVKTLNKMKNGGEPLSWITAYDYPMSSAVEEAGIDMILVGDSGGMVQLGYTTTNPVTMDEMITMTKAVRRGAPNTFIVGDMPQGSYEIGDKEAVQSALRFAKESLCDAVKLEGGRRVRSQIKSIVDAGILTIGHLGLTPQSASSFGGYSVQGKTQESFEEIFEDALAVQDAGACALLLEAMPSEPAGQIARQLKIPVYGIGAGNCVDGQLIILHDMIGLYPVFRPYFAKNYIPTIMDDFSKYINSFEDIKKLGRESQRDGLFVMVKMAVESYIKDVKSKKFPSVEFSYPIKDEHLKDLRKSKFWSSARSHERGILSDQSLTC
ncbi:3-methyl-2-oxobutanoate hydroxymethyltransferase [Bacteriovoracales bacterium]|nr:3-methyl-2-oxobutanoate hydroxymethyltransferase [Bacteriovoracales bacterium]